MGLWGREGGSASGGVSIMYPFSPQCVPPILPFFFPYFLLSPGPSETPNSSLPCSLSSTQVPASPSFPKGLPGWSQHRIHTHFWLVLTCSPTAQPCRCSGETSRLSSVVTQWAYQVSPLWDTGCWLTGEGGCENRGVGTMRVPAC